MPRETFPFEDDRLLVWKFLVGGLSPPTDWLKIENGRLHTATNSHAVAWFDTAGALVVQMPVGYQTPMSMRLINTIAEFIGTPHRVEQEVHALDETGPDVRYYIDGQQLQFNAPHVLVGALGMRAWRESMK